MKNLRQSIWDHDILYADGCLKDERLLMGHFNEKTKDTNMEGGWNFKFMFCFMETIHEPLHLLLYK
jgi:hypothetical protein